MTDSKLVCWLLRLLGFGRLLDELERLQLENAMLRRRLENYEIYSSSEAMNREFERLKEYFREKEKQEAKSDI